MKLDITKSTLLIASLFFAIGCGDTSTTPLTDDTQNTETNTTGLPENVETALNGEKSTLSEELANTISYMGNEERLAYDVYNKLYTLWGTKQFTNIATNSEQKHISAVQQLVQKYAMNDGSSFTNVDLPALGYANTPIEDMQAGTYDIAKIQNLYDDLVAKGSVSEVEALKVACMVEVIDVEDLDKYLLMAEESNATDVKEVFTLLRAGSYNHYWVFNNALTKQGVTDGCCNVGTIDGRNYCHPEYPQKEK